MKSTILYSSCLQPYWLPGLTVEGNACADKLTAPVQAAPVPDMLQRFSHISFSIRGPDLYNINSILHLQQHVMLLPHALIVSSMSLWFWMEWTLEGYRLFSNGSLMLLMFQNLVTLNRYMDISFKAWWASVLAGQKARDVISHRCGAFAALGVPRVVKTDNGLGYVAQRAQQFLQSRGVQCVTGIAHSSTSQAIVEHIHHKVV